MGDFTNLKRRLKEAEIREKRLAQAAEDLLVTWTEWYGEHKSEPVRKAVAHIRLVLAERLDH